MNEINYLEKSQYIIQLANADCKFVISGDMDLDTNNIALSLREPMAQSVAILYRNPELLNSYSKLDFPYEMHQALAALTLNMGEDDQTYLMRVKNNALARSVKLAELQYFSTISTISEEEERQIGYLLVNGNCLCDTCKYCTPNEDFSSLKCRCMEECFQGDSRICPSFTMGNCR